MEECNANGMIGVEVKHVRFGKGVVVGVEGIYLCIEFGTVGVKKFQYPDAFEMFLSVEDESVKAKIASDFEIRKEDDDYIATKRTQESYDNVKEFWKRKEEEHERKIKMQIEKQRQAQLMREQRMQSSNSTNRNFNR